MTRDKNLLSYVLLTAALTTLLFPNSIFAQSWTSLPNMKRERFESSAVQYNSDIYVFNGFGKSIKIEPTVEKFDAATRTWSIVGGTSVVYGNAVTHNGIVRVGNEVWLIGGRKGNHPGKVSNQVWKYNLTTGSWIAGPSLPQPAAAGGAALINNKIHWFGGLDPQAKCDVGHHYFLDLNNLNIGWQNISGYASMPSPRNHFATAVFNGWIYAIGGQYGHDSCPGKPGQDTNLVHAFNPQTNQWVQKASLPSVQSHMEPSTFVHHGAIYVIGGEQNGNKIFRYDAAQDDWDTVGTLPGNLVAPVARVVNNKLVVASGGAPNAFSPSAATRSTDISPFILPGSQADENDDGNNSSSQSNTGSTEIQDGESYISIEAEYYDTNTTTSTHAWQTTNLSNSSNDAAVITTPDTGALALNSSNSPELGYFTVFDRPGTWYVWIRGWGNTNLSGEGSSDSVHAGLNGKILSTADKIDYFPAGWNWSNSTRDAIRATVSVPTAGVHAFNLWMREDGLAIDKIILTTDASYSPSGNGPVSTNGASINHPKAEGSSIDDSNIETNEDIESASNSDSSTVAYTDNNNGGNDGSEAQVDSTDPTVTDLIALHYDVSPDLDDLHAIAAGANISNKFSINPALVIGAYGHVDHSQFGNLKSLYNVETNTLGQGPNIGETRRQKARAVADIAYGSGNYLDTGEGWTQAVNAQATKFWTVLKNGNLVSIAEGGPMDFTADVLTRLQTYHGATSSQLKNIRVVQHSLGFNVQQTLPANLAKVINLATYITIDNGNVGNNSTADLKDRDTNTTSSNFARWARNDNCQSAAWIAALDRFNSHIDFSDTVEYLHIMNVPITTVSNLTTFAEYFDFGNNSCVIAPPECNGRTVTVDLSKGQVPTSGDDVILGTSGDDVIDALDGNDTVCALAGNDVINSGPGNDWVDAGAGDDTVDGGSDNDSLFGDSGSDILKGGDGNDELFGEDDDDLLEGNSGDDSLDGGNGVNQLIGGSGSNTIIGLDLLTVNQIDTNSYGHRFGSDQNRESKSFSFPASNDNLILSVDGYDIDFNNEVEVLLNGISLGFLSRSPNNAFNSGDSFTLNAADISPGDNTLSFQNSTPGFVWGISNITLMELPLIVGQPDVSQYGHLFGSNQNRESKSFSFPPSNDNLILSVDGYDIDFIDEVEVLLNGTSLGFLSRGPNNAFNSGDSFSLNAADINSGDNTLSFQNSTPGFVWGISNVLLSPGTTTLSLGQTDSNLYGHRFGSDQNRESKSFSFPPSNDNLILSVDGYDIDFIDEVEVLLNGTSLGFLSRGPNNAFNPGDSFSLNAADINSGENTLSFQNSTPGFIWGVSNVSLVSN